MAIYGINYIHEFKFPFPKKKKKEPEKKSERPKKQERIPITDELRKEITKNLKEIVNNYNTKDHLVKGSMDDLREYFEEDSDKWDGKYHKLGCKEFEHDDYYVSYDLSPIDSGQYDKQSYNMALQGTRDAIGRNLDKLLPYGIETNTDYGDGDEGIIEIFGFKD